MTASADQLTKKGMCTRARLLATAEQELLEHGRIAVTRVAERANVSLGLLYRYFENKDGLVSAVIDAFYDRYEQAVFAVVAPPGSHWFEHELQRIEREVAFFFEDPLGRDIVGGTPSEPAAAYADTRRLAKHIDLATRNIVHGQKRGEIVSSVAPDLAAAAIIGALRACLAVALADESRTSSGEVIETMRHVSAGILIPIDLSDDASKQ